MPLTPSTPSTPRILKEKNNDLLSSKKRLKKRKLNDEKENINNDGNYLRKVELSDGSICYTVSSMSSSSKEPPKKKIKTNSYFGNIGHIGNNGNNGNIKKPKLIYSQTMPPPINNNNNKKRRRERKRRHSGDWTSRDNLIASLKQQELIEEELFPSIENGNVPYVNLKEMFNGLPTIRVHKRERDINERRRETKLFR